MANNIDTSTKVTLNEVVGYLERCIKIKRPAFLWAGPGIGKSSVIAAIAKQFNGVSIDMRLSQMQPTDIIGIPYFDSTTTKMRWAPSEYMPTEEFAKQYPLVILFLDEMNSAPPAVQAAAYQLVLDRKAGTYTLPDNVVIIAAGNQDSDKGVTYRMPKPLENRFLHYVIKEDFQSWLDWAIPAGVHSDVIAYLAWSKEKLYQFNPNSADKSFPTPRSWEFVSQILHTNTPDNPMNEKEMLDMIGAAIGHGEATSFLTYSRIGKNLPHPDDILSGKVTDLNTKDVSAHYQLIVSTLHSMREYWEKNSTLKDSWTTVGSASSKRKFQERKWNNEKVHTKWVNMFDNFNTYIMKNFSKEIGIMACRMAISNYCFGKSTDLIKLKTFTQMTQTYFKFIYDPADNN